MADTSASALTPALEDPSAEESAAKPEGEPPGAEGPPEWLTAAFLQRALATAAAWGDGVRVAAFREEPAVGKGDNYASYMLRVHVDVEDDGSSSVRSVIVKSPPLAALSRQWVDRVHLFPREGRMYCRTLAAMRALLAEPLEGRPFRQLAPRLLYANDDEGVMIFEDLREQGFKMARRQSGLDMTHCVLALRALATFHALSMALHAEDPASTDYDEPFFKESLREDMEMFNVRAFQSLSKQVASWPGFERFADKLVAFGKVCYQSMIDLFASGEDRFKVLNHGDFWVNNMLFKYDESTGQPTEIRVIDFQMCRYNSLALDLNYFLFSSVRPDIRTERMDEMLSVYHTTLVEVLERLGLAERAVSWEELQCEMRRFMPFALLSACNLLAIVLAEPSEALDFGDATEEDIRSGDVDMLAKPLAGQNYACALQQLLPYFERQGAL